MTRILLFQKKTQPLSKLLTTKKLAKTRHFSLILQLIKPEEQARIGRPTTVINQNWTRNNLEDWVFQTWIRMHIY